MSISKTRRKHLNQSKSKSTTNIQHGPGAPGPSVYAGSTTATVPGVQGISWTGQLILNFPVLGSGVGHRDGKRFVVRAADPSHGRGGLPGTKGGNGVAVGAGVALEVATCACASAEKATKPTRTHTLRRAIPDRIGVLAAGCGS